MAFDGSTCLENQNSTDCLLRTLLQLLNDQRNAEDAETNWDPITFWVTLFIGILAALFTIVTIVQAAVAAGKGRRKTNRVAIGNWSERTTRHWGRHELNRQYTAQTPLILVDTLVKALKERGDKSQYANPAEGIGSQLPDSSQPMHQPSSTATWVRFLQDVCLSEVVSPSGWNEHESVLADNLPDGVVAPAYAQVGVIVGTTLALGAHMQIQHGAGLKYPLIVGDGFQFEFLPYPMLGMVGTYYRHGRAALPSSPSSNELTWRMAINNMNYGRGVLEFATMAPFDKFQHETIDLLNDTDRLRIRQLLVQPKPHGKVKDHPLPKLKSIADDYIPLISLFWAITPKSVPSLFPTSTLSMDSPFTTIALSGTFWSRLDLRKFCQTKITTWPDSVDTPRWDRFEWNGLHATLGDGVHINKPGDTGFRFNHRRQRLKSILERCHARMKFESEGLEGPERAFRNELEAIEGEGKINPMKTEKAIANMRAELARATIDNAKSHDETQDVLDKRMAEPKLAQAMARLEIKRAQTEAVSAKIKAEAAEAEEEDQRIQLHLAAIRMKQYEHQITHRGGTDTNYSFIKTYNNPENRPEVNKSRIEGHCVVLHMCIKMLHDPADLLSWFFSISSRDQTIIRSIILDQMDKADTWLSSDEIPKELVNNRRAILCNTTISLIEAEKATGQADVRSFANSNLAVDYPSMKSSKPKRPHECPHDEYIGRRHLEALQYLHGVYERYGVDEATFQATRALENFSQSLAGKESFQPHEILALKRNQLHSTELLESRALEIQGSIPNLLGSSILEDHDYANLHRLLERLGEIADHHLDIIDEKSFQDDFSMSIDVDLGTKKLKKRQMLSNADPEMKEQMGVRMKEEMDIDDVFIYRYLLMALLFQTAQDSSEILGLGVWDQVVPII